jgi:hypothetical protein
VFLLYLNLIFFYLKSIYSMNNYFTQLRSCISVHLFSVLSMALLCFANTSVQAQIPAGCTSAKMYYYDVLGNQAGAYPLTAGKFSGGTLAGVTIATAVNNGAPNAKYTGISNGYYTFSTAAGQEYYDFATGTFLAPVRPMKLLPDPNVPPAFIKGVPWLGNTRPHAGDEISGTHPDFIDVDTYLALMKDADGSLSLYDFLTCSINSDYTWKTFTGGSLNGQAPTKATINMGTEGLLLFHNNGNDIEYYSTITGVFVAITNPAPFPKAFVDGPLAGVSVGAAMTNGLLKALPAPNANIVYLGVDAAYQLTFYDKTTNKVFEYDRITLAQNLYVVTDLSGAANYDFVGNLSAVLSPSFLGVGGSRLEFRDNSGYTEFYNTAVFTAAGAAIIEYKCGSYWDGDITVGPHGGEMVMDKCGLLTPVAPLTSPKVFSMTELCYVLIDNDNTLSYYGFLGNKIWDLKWTTYTGGSLNGQAVINMTNILSAENGYILAVNAAGDIEVYYLYTGAYTGVTYDNTDGKFKNGPLKGQTLNQAMLATPCGGAGVPGATYLGFDGVWNVFAVCEEAITVTKALVSAVADPANSGFGLTTYEMVIENTGSVDLTNVTLTDNLFAQMGCGFAAIATAPTITSSTATTAPSVNAGFNGNANPNIFNGTTGLLKQGQKITVRFTAKVNLTCGAALPNVAKVGATGGGAPISSLSTKPAEAAASATAVAAALAAGATPAEAAAAGAAAALPGATPESIAAALLAASAAPTSPRAIAAAVAAGKTACASLVGGSVGANQTVCYYEATAPLSVPAAIATGAWVGGTGTFTPNRTTAVATYTPTLAENGTTVVLTWVPAPAASICSLYDLTTDVIVRPVPVTMTCSGNVNVSLPAPSCTLPFLAEMVLRSERNGCYGTYTVKLETLTGETIPSATLTSAHIGTTVRAIITNPFGNTCWGNVVVEDKAAPTIGTPTNLTLNCDDRNAIGLLPLAPASTTPATTFGGTVTTTVAATATVAARTGIPMPSFTDCSQRAVSFSDVSLLNVTCPDAAKFATATAGLTLPAGATASNTIRIVRRTYSAKDIFGNTSANSTPQYIYVVRNVTTPTAAPVALTCEDAYPAITSNIPTPAGVCGLSFSFLNDLRVDLCGRTYKVVRTWQIIDQCGTGTMASTLTQIITVSDAVNPTLTVTGTSYDLVTVQTLTTCTSPAILNKLQPSNQTSGTIGGAAGATSGSITVNAWADANVCGMGTFSVNVAGADNCGTATITSSDSRYPVAAGVISGTVMGNTSFVVTSTDQCGNSVSVTVNVNVIDNLSPTAICDGVSATLNNYQRARITGASFNNRSSDNCGIVRILVAKNQIVAGSPDSPGAFCDFVEYGCGDRNVAGLKVWVRYIDAAGNFTDCCVPVEIKDKSTISCVNNGNTTIDCNDPRLNVYETLFKRPTFFYDGCSAVTVDSANSSVAINCGVGSYTRSWAYTITNSVGTFTTPRCTSTVTVSAIRGFRLTPLANQNLDCAGAVRTKEQDQADIIASLKLLHTGAGAGAGTQPASGSSVYTTCSAPAVDITESVYSNTDYCKVIVRTYVVKDLCLLSTATSSQTAADEFVPVDNGDYQSFIKDGGHYIRYTRTITIRDRTAPTSKKVQYREICAAPTACTFDFSQLLEGADLCGGAASGSNLFYSWTIVSPAGVETRGVGSTVSATGLAFGTYAVFFYVNDVCGNISARDSFSLRGKDCVLPQILVHNKIIELGGQVSSGVGSVTLNYRDIRNRITDNCTPFDLTDDSKVTMEVGGVTTNTRPTATVGTQSVTFTCAQAGTVQNVRVWAVDASGNWNYVVTQITVQDNIGICRLTAMVGGLVGTENNSPVKDVVISANANGLVAGSATSPAAGSFLVTNLTVGANYQVRAAKTIDTDKKNGVTTLDIALISKHNLGIEALNSPYKIIAADVNKDGEVDATDMLHIRRFILNITPTLPAGSAWRFIDKSYAFRNAANPLGEDFSEVVNLSSVPAGQSAANFTAVKLGDVNNSFDATQVRGSRALVLNANDRDVVAGNEYTVAINAENFNAAAFQGTFAFEGASVKAVKAGSLNNTSDANFGMFNNAVTASWNGKSEASADVVNITFIATKSGKLSDMLTVNSSVTMAEGYDAAGNAMNVSLKFNTGKVAGGEFALYANTPNPFSTSTTIGFNLPKDGQAKLTVYTAGGKVLFVKNDNFKAGVNQVTVNKADLNASGMLYYRLDTQDNSSTKKMIIIE